MQVKLLRFLESGEIRRVGENEAFHADVRVVCATNRDLQDMVREGSFREDLYFRTNTFEIRLPPLRERREDIPDLARTLIARYLKRRDVPESVLAPETVAVLQQHSWAGNVRELANALEHAAIMSDDKVIRPEDLPASILRGGQGGAVVTESILLPKQALTLREIEMDVIYKVLDKHQGDKPKAAAELGIALKTLYNKLNSDQGRVAG
jgi:transcriptional regulator with PAS, ATPase and Fis domain